MRRFARLIAVSLTLLAVAACQPPEKDKAAGPHIPPTGSDDTREVALAFNAAWDHPPPATATNRGQPDSAVFTFTTAELTPLGGGRYALVSSGQGQYDSHASSGALAIHYLERTPGGFRRASWPPLIVEDGQYGVPSDWSVRSDLLPGKAVVTTSTGTGMGYSCDSAIIIELTQERPVVRADRVRLGFSNEGAVEDPKDVQEMEGVLRSGASQGEFVVQYSGASKARVIWRLTADGRYRPVNEPADLPWC